MKTIKLKTFIENPDNPQKYGDDDIAALVESIRQEPRTLGAAKIAFCTDYTATNGASYAGRRVVIAGNKRLSALQEIARAGGLRDPGDADAWLVSPQGDAPAAWFFDLTPLGPDARRHWLLESNIGRGEWDAEKLLAQFTRDELSDHFDAEALAEILGAEPDEAKDGETDPDAVPTAPKKPVSKRGEVYQCGEHRLMCGDSTSAADVTRLMWGKADMLLTYPPYNVALGMGGSFDEARKRHRRTDGLVIANDSMPDSEFHDFLVRFYRAAADAMKPGAAFYIFHADNEGLNFRSALKESGLTLRQTLIWVKNSMTLGRQDYQWRHEPCLYGWKDGTHRWFGDRKQTTCLEFDRPTVSKQHPTMKPVKMFEYLMKQSTKSGEIVADFFGGSGTTMIAAESLGRKARLMELDPHYCDVIRKRWAEFTHGEGCDWQALTPRVTSAALTT